MEAVPAKCENVLDSRGRGKLCANEWLETRDNEMQHDGRADKAPLDYTPSRAKAQGWSLQGRHERGDSTVTVITQVDIKLSLIGGKLLTSQSIRVTRQLYCRTRKHLPISQVASASESCELTNCRSSPNIGLRNETL